MPVAGWEDVLDFWFGEGAEDPAIAQEKEKLWFRKSAETDQLIRARFGDLPDALADGLAADWLKIGPRGRLAAMVGLDQFPRNLHRGSAQAFAYDALAVSLCQEGLNVADDLALNTFERLVYYLPLEHSEDIADQAEAVARFKALQAHAPEHLAEHAASALDYGRRHRAVIEQFGRFPHRNEALGRASTAQELAFLAQPGSRF